MALKSPEAPLQTQGWMTSSGLTATHCSIRRVTPAGVPQFMAKQRVRPYILPLFDYRNSMFSAWYINSKPSLPPTPPQPPFLGVRQALEVFSPWKSTYAGKHRVHLRFLFVRIDLSSESWALTSTSECCGMEWICLLPQFKSFFHSTCVFGLFLEIAVLIAFSTIACARCSHSCTE